MDPILSTIDDALKKKGLSDAAASKLAVGHPSLIKNFRMERSGEKRYNLAALQKLAETLDLELYFGPKRDTAAPPPTIEIDGDDFATIKRVSAEVSAGPGAFNGDAEVVGSLAFRQDWLRERGVRPDRALLVTVKGSSMDPHIKDGDLVLVDLDRTQVENGEPYVLIDGDGQTLLKRLHRLGRHGLVLVSDNPAYPPELRHGSDAERVAVLGRVIWSGHSWG